MRTGPFRSLRYTSFSIKERGPQSICLQAITHFPFSLACCPRCAIFFCNCALLCRGDKGTMKQGHRLSCKRSDAIFWLAAPSRCLNVCLCVSGRVGYGRVGWDGAGWGGGRGCKAPAGDEPRPSRQQLRRTDSGESLQLFLSGRRGELLIECECKLQRLLIWPWLERRTPGAGGVGVGVGY